MKLLLDTHALLWWLADDDQLGEPARAAIAKPTNFVYVSAASAWEIAVKRAAGKLVAPGDIEEWIATNNFAPLPIDVPDAVASAELPTHHRDPFDRLLVAQAQRGDMTVVTKDDSFTRYGVPVLAAG